MKSCSAFIITPACWQQALRASCVAGHWYSHRWFKRNCGRITPSFSSCELTQSGPNLIAGRHYAEASGQPEGANRIPKAQEIRWLSDFNSLYVLLQLGNEGRVGVTSYLLTAAGQSNPVRDKDSRPPAHVFTIIRPSQMDFERNSYETF